MDDTISSSHDADKRIQQGGQSAGSSSSLSGALSPLYPPPLYPRPSAGLADERACLFVQNNSKLCGRGCALHGQYQVGDDDDSRTPGRRPTDARVLASAPPGADNCTDEHDPRSAARSPPPRASYRQRTERAAPPAVGQSSGHRRCVAGRDRSPRTRPSVTLADATTRRETLPGRAIIASPPRRVASARQNSPSADSYAGPPGRMSESDRCRSLLGRCALNCWSYSGGNCVIAPAPVVVRVGSFVTDAQAVSRESIRKCIEIEPPRRNRHGSRSAVDYPGG